MNANPGQRPLYLWASLTLRLTPPEKFYTSDASSASRSALDRYSRCLALSPRSALHSQYGTASSAQPAARSWRRLRAVEPVGAWLRPHCSQSNEVLKVHLPLVVPSDGTAWLRMTDEDGGVPFRAGEPIIFDDTFEHEVWNNSTTQARTTLMLVIGHPVLTGCVSA